MVIARKHDILVEEWTNPLTTPFNVSRQAGTRLVYNIRCNKQLLLCLIILNTYSGVNYQSEIDRFKEFLFRSGKYNSIVVETKSNLNSNQHKKIVLLEDWPNFLYRDPSKIVELLK